MPCPLPSNPNVPWHPMRGVPAGPPPPQPFPSRPAQGSCTEGHGWIWDCSFSGVPAWPWFMALCAMVGVTPLVSAICCGRCHFWCHLWCFQSSPCHVPGALGGAALPTWSSPRHRGVSVLSEPGAAAAPSVLTGPLCPQVLLFLQEKEEENHQASQVSSRGRAERRARLLSLWPWLDLAPRSPRPLGLDGDGGAGPDGLPQRPTRSWGAGPPQTACPFLRHSWPFTRTKPNFAEVPASVKQKKKKKRKTHGVTCFEFITGLKWGSTTDSDPSLSEEDEDNFKSSGLRRNIFFSVASLSLKLI